MEPVEKRNYNTEQRRQLADEGKALPDGSYPIVDKADLANALQAVGRASNRAQVEAHIRRRAKALDAMDMLPDWAMTKTENVIETADLHVLDALHHFALEFVSEQEWIGVVSEVRKAGGIRNTEGYARLILEKATAQRQSFAGNRSAAGSYAANMRWRGSNSGGLEAAQRQARQAAEERYGKAPAGGTSGNANAEVEKPRYATAFNDEGLMAETETSINRAYDKSGFGAEKGDALAAVEGTRKTLYDAQKSLEFGVPVETVRGGLVKESRRLKSLSTRTTKKGQELQIAEGGRKKDADGKWIMTRSARFFTDAQIFKNMSQMLDRTAKKLDALKP